MTENETTKPELRLGKIEFAPSQNVPVHRLDISVISKDQMQKIVDMAVRQVLAQLTDSMDRVFGETQTNA